MRQIHTIEVNTHLCDMTVDGGGQENGPGDNGIEERTGGMVETGVHLEAVAGENDRDRNRA